MIKCRKAVNFSTETIIIILVSIAFAVTAVAITVHVTKNILGEGNSAAYYFFEDKNTGIS